MALRLELCGCWLPPSHWTRKLFAAVGVFSKLRALEHCVQIESEIKFDDSAAWCLTADIVMKQKDNDRRRRKAESAPDWRHLFYFIIAVIDWLAMAVKTQTTKRPLHDASDSMTWVGATRAETTYFISAHSAHRMYFICSTHCSVHAHINLVHHKSFVCTSQLVAVPTNVYVRMRKRSRAMPSNRVQKKIGNVSKTFRFLLLSTRIHGASMNRN